MKQKLILAKRDGCELEISLNPSERVGDLFIIKQTNGLGEIKELYLSYKEADEIREWLNRNLPR